MNQTKTNKVFSVIATVLLLASTSFAISPEAVRQLPKTANTTNVAQTPAPATIDQILH